MSLLEQKYRIKGRHDDVHFLTARQIYERIKEDSKSDYNWIASTGELVKICKISSFPNEYAIAIKIAILNCYSNIEHRANCGGDRYYDNPADVEAVQYCYNSLYGIDTEDAILSRKKYLIEMIARACYVRVFSALYHPGPTYRKLREDFIHSKFEEYISQEEINFKQLVKTLRSEFTEVVKTAEENGDFEEDKKKTGKVGKCSIKD